MLFEKTDEEIINLYKNGNKEAFKALIDKYTSPLYNFIVRFAGQDNAPDLIQETFIKVWKNIGHFDFGKASFKTWLFVIAKNNITDFLRKKKHLNFSDLEKLDDDSSFPETIPDDSSLPNEVLEKLEDTKLLNNLLNKLPENYRTVLILHYQEEMTFFEIGEILNKPLNTVKSYHRRAIEHLRKDFNN